MGKWKFFWSSIYQLPFSLNTECFEIKFCSHSVIFLNKQNIFIYLKSNVMWLWVVSSVFNALTALLLKVKIKIEISIFMLGYLFLSKGYSPKMFSVLQMKMQMIFLCFKIHLTVQLREFYPKFRDITLECNNMFSGK